MRGVVAGAGVLGVAVAVVVGRFFDPLTACAVVSVVVVVWCVLIVVEVSAVVALGLVFAVSLLV